MRFIGTVPTALQYYSLQLMNAQINPINNMPDPNTMHRTPIASAQSKAPPTSSYPYTAASTTTSSTTAKIASKQHALLRAPF